MICPCYQDAKNLRSYAICHWIFASIDFEWQSKNDMLKCWRLNAVSFISSFNWTWIKSCVSCNIIEFIDCDEIKWYVLMYLDHAISIFCLLEFLIYFNSNNFLMQSFYICNSLEYILFKIYRYYWIKSNNFSSNIN